MDKFKILTFDIAALENPEFYIKLPTTETDLYSNCSPKKSLLYRNIEKPNIIIAKPCGLNTTTINVLKAKTSKHNFLFSIRKFRQLGDRTHVIIYCVDKKDGNITRNIYYTSRSEIGSWRYCTIREGDDNYDKGANYVCTTYAHIQIQKFIYDMKKKFDIDTSDPFISCPRTEDPSMLEYKNRLENPKYKSSNMIFMVFDTIFESGGNIMVEYAECLEKLDNFLRDPIVFPEMKLLYSTLKKYLMTNDVYRNIRVGESRRSFFKRVYTSMEMMFDTYFRILPDTLIKIISDYTYALYGVNIYANIYEVECECIHTDPGHEGKKYIIRYMIYNTTSDKSEETVINKKAILHIIPSNSTIMKYGLDSRYVSAGAFINKIFDYIEQADVTLIVGSDPKKTYTFIGDFVDYSFLPEPAAARRIPAGAETVYERPAAARRRKPVRAALAAAAAPPPPVAAPPPVALLRRAVAAAAAPPVVAPEFYTAPRTTVRRAAAAPPRPAELPMPVKAFTSGAAPAGHSVGYPAYRIPARPVELPMPEKFKSGAEVEYLGNHQFYTIGVIKRDKKGMPTYQLLSRTTAGTMDSGLGFISQDRLTPW
jgi:hypothetical protein